jgi:hypothetical protein
MACKHEGGTGPCKRSAKRNCYAQQRQYHAERRATPEGGYRLHIDNCRARGLENELTMEQYQWLRTQPCAYCDEPASGVDRVKSEYGYTLLNSVPCCWSCNRSKNNLDVKAFVIAINAASKHSPSYEIFKQRWIKVREELCRSTNTNATRPVAENELNASSASSLPTSSDVFDADSA